MNRLLPAAFIDSISEQLPDHLEIDDLITACHQPLRFSMRVNVLKISVVNFIDLMSPLGWSFTPIPWCLEGFWVDFNNEDTVPGKLPEHLIGLFYIQEASSMLPPVALFNGVNHKAKFDHVLDLAAAPGSKTTQIAGLMENNGLLIANEYSSSRIKALHSNLTRLGITNTMISHFDGSVHGDYLENQFDAILLDAPCSGEGTVRKDPDAFKNWSLGHIAEITDVQKRLIVSAFKALKPGGQLVYSTCALNFSENQAVCQFLLDTFGDTIDTDNLGDLFPAAEKSVTEQGYLHIWPQIYDSEGFFVAKFTKLGASNLSNDPVFRSKFPFQPLSNKALDLALTALKPLCNIDDIDKDNLYQRDDEIWYFATDSEHFTDKMRFVRHGIKLIDIKSKKYNVSHEALCCFGVPTFNLNREQLVEYLKGRDLAVNNSEGAKGEIVLGYQGVAVGLGKWVGNKVKNKLPRSLVNDHVLIS